MTSPARKREAAEENPFAGRTYAEAMALLVQRHGNSLALVFGDRRFTFAEARTEVDLAARRLSLLGLSRGQTVAILMSNRPEFIWYWLAAAQIGLIAVFLNTRLKQPEFLYQLRQSDSRALITVGSAAIRDFIGDFRQACPEMADQPAGHLRLKELPELRHVICVDRLPESAGGITDWSMPAALLPAAPTVQTDATAPAVIAYSSGTTALPKGAMLNHCVWRKAWDGGVRFELTPSDRLFHAVPLFGVLGFLSGILMFWTHGCAVILEERFDAGRCLELLQKEKCTCIHLLPVMIDQLMEHPAFASADLSRLRAGIVLSNDPAIMRKAANQLGVRGASSGYGLTESTGLVTRGWLDEPLEERLKSHGRPLPGCAIRVVDPETGADAPVGQTGEIWIGGYSVMVGYYKKPDETGKAITADGWLRTGDAGFLNPDGTLVFLQRLGDGYKHKGFNVSTAEVEAVLRQHPMVADAAVISLPHERDGAIGVAFAIPRPGSSPSPDDVLQFLKERMASFKRPAHLFFVEEFPRTGGTEKIQKFKLREIAEARLAGGAT